MVEIEVEVAKAVHEVSRLEAADLGHHHRQKGVAGDVEGHAQEGVGAALVKLAGEAPVLVHVKLEEGVAGRQGHLVDFGRVPGADNVPARMGLGLDLGNDLGDLVQGALGAWPGAPLMPIDRAQLAFLVSPFVPDRHLVVAQVLNIGVAAEEPEQLMNDGAQVGLLGRHKGEAGAQIKTALVAKDAQGPHASAVFPFFAMLKDVLQEIQILFHGIILNGFGPKKKAALKRKGGPF
jgi:hypothetical protein